MSIYLKLLAVQKAVDTIPKRGYNDFHKYHYATEADILSVKEKINANGLVVLADMTHHEIGFKPDGKTGWAKVTCTFRVVDVETGECVETQFPGYAEDKFDKSIYKAMTGANKYFYLKYFGVATGDDPEQESQAPEEKNTAPVVPAKVQVQPEKNTAPATDLEKHRAKVVAGEIAKLQKQHKLSDERVQEITKIRSLRGLVSVGGVATLEGGLQRMRAAL